MSELLYNKSKAVEELNKVEGFYPLELARVISNEGQEEQRYLDVKYRKLWFRLVNPTGKIISRIVHFTENMAVVEARIYLDKCDQEDNYIANSFSQKFRTADIQFGDKFLEMAETAAIGRALADAGYGLQFADVGEGNDPMQVDAGIPVNQGTAKNRTVRINQELTAMHQEVIENLESIHGALLRMNRSIQAEGTFGIMKNDRWYKRIVRRGINSVKLEVLLVAIGHNLYKYQNKKMRNRTAA